MNFEPVLKGAVVSFFLPMRISILGNLGSTGEQSRTKSPRSFCQRRGRSRNIMAASRGFLSGVVKVLVSFYRSGEDSAFERHRSRVTFDLSKQASVAAVKKHLTEFLGQGGFIEIWHGEF